MDNFSMNDRVHQIRAALRLSQTSFAEGFGGSRDMIANVENHRTMPSERMQKALYKFYNVNPRFLETGEGEMFIDQLPDLSREMRTLLKGQSEFTIRVFTALAKMPKEFWDEWERALKEETKKTPLDE